MLDINYINTHTTLVTKQLERRGYHNADQQITSLLGINTQRKAIQTALDQHARSLNQHTREIKKLVACGQSDRITAIQRSTLEIKLVIKELKCKLQHCKTQLQQALYELPNLPHADVPTGRGEAHNVCLHQYTPISPPSTESLLPHWELTTKYTLVNFKFGNKVAGTGFPVYQDQGAILQRALINFLLDRARQAGYEEIQPPLITNEISAYGTGQLPDKEGQMYQLREGPYYLIPTAEVPLTNLYRDTILSTHQLPIKHVAYTPCFRREAGTWGKQVRGLNRLHQFDKVELVEIHPPETSYKALQRMRVYVQGLLEQLGLPYRVIKLCGGDLGFTAALTYDLEVWAAGQKRWLEVSSISTCEAYQARRLQLRYRDQSDKIHTLHTLNGSAVALPRVIAALLEYNQDNEKINVPTILHAYTGFKTIERKR